MAVEYLVAGLGNPGPRYDRSPHNAGFLVADRLRARARGPAFVRRGEAEVSLCRWRGNGFLVVKPQTFMNLSGRAVARLLREEDLPPQRLVVVFDDLDLPFGRVRLRAAGGTGGHHGMESIVEHLGTASFPRVRLGIQDPEVPKEGQVDYLLTPLPAPRYAILEAAAERAAEAVLDAVAAGFTAAMNRHNRREPESEGSEK